MSASPSFLSPLFSVWLMGWFPDHSWTSHQLCEMERHLRAIGGALGVLDEQGEELFDSRFMEYQSHVIFEAIKGTLCHMLQSSPSPFLRYTVSPSKHEGPLEGLVSARMIPKLNVYTASLQDLAALPGLGQRSASRIVQSRSLETPFEEADDLRKVAGISKDSFAKVLPFLDLALPMTTVHHKWEKTFRESGLSSLVHLIATNQMQVSFVSASAPVDVLLQLLAGVSSHVQKNRIRPRFWIPSPERLLRANEAMLFTRWYQTQAHPTEGVSPVSSRSYYPLLLEMLRQAKQRIWCQMFFFTVGEEGSPGDNIIQLLLEAKQRGVDVRLILDQDLDGDYHGSRIVNADAFEALERFAIPTRPSLFDVTLHKKVVLIDERFVLLGSHNWTNSSFFRYEDTSMLVVSTGLNQEAATHHEQMWERLGSPVRIALSMLELFTPAQKSLLAKRGCINAEHFYQETKSLQNKRELAKEVGSTETHIALARDVLQLMESFRISETTSVALALRGMNAPSKVKRASLEQLTTTFQDLSDLPPPFHRRRIPAGIARYIWKHA